MSKVTVTFEDTEDKSVTINTEFDPPILNNDGTESEMTPAQYMALKVVHLAIHDNKDIESVKTTPKDTKLNQKSRILTPR